MKKFSQEDQDNLAGDFPRRTRAPRCECGEDLPGFCPGVGVCPHAAPPDDEDDGDDFD